MMQKIDIYPVNAELSFVKVLEELFPYLNAELPIYGGWGYSKEDAIVIDKDDSVVNKDIPFNGVRIEYLIAEKRTYIETTIARPAEDRYSGVKLKLEKQRLVVDGDKAYDHLTFDVTAHTDKDYSDLKTEYEEGMKRGTLNMEEHLRKNRELLRSYKTEFWFDITSFYNS